MPWPLRMITYAGILLLIILIYFGYRYFKSVKEIDLQPKRFFISLYFIAAALFLAYPVAGHLQYWITGSFNRTGFPDAMLYLFWYGVVCMGVMLNWLLLHDLLRPLFLRFSGRDAGYVKHKFAKSFLIIAALSMAYTAGKMIWDTSRITTENIIYSMPEGESLSQPLRIVHIADLHADDFTGVPKMNRYIEKVNGANPDIVIFAGDLITSGTDHIEAGADALAGIDATHGVFFVMGDHDYWTGPSVIANALQERGITVLQNENIFIDHHDTRIKITGVTELYSHRVDPPLLSELLSENKNENMRLLASHQATGRLTGKGADNEVHLLLAGHTHGGQIRVPVFFYPFTAARAESEYVTGNWYLGKMLLNINNGLGFTLAPVRYKAPAQVSIITVH